MVTELGGVLLAGGVEGELLDCVEEQAPSRISRISKAGRQVRRVETVTVSG